MMPQDQALSSAEARSDLPHQFVRGMALTGFVVGGLGLIYKLAQFYYQDYSFRAGPLGKIDFFISIAENAALLIGSVGLWREQRFARRCLVVWGYSTILWGVFNLVFNQLLPTWYQIHPSFSQVRDRNYSMSYDIAHFAAENCFPLFAVFMLSHHDVARECGVEEPRGFEVLPVAQVSILTAFNSTHENDRKA